MKKTFFSCERLFVESLAARCAFFFINQDGLDMKNNTENSWLLSNSSSSVFTEGSSARCCCCCVC